MSFRFDNEFPELLKLDRIIKEGVPHLQTRKVCEVVTDGRRFPVYALCLGNPSPEVPGVGFFGGMHGLERIGTQVLEELRRRGHELDVAPDWTEGFVSCASFCEDTGLIEAGCDPRGAKSHCFPAFAVAW